MIYDALTKRLLKFDRFLVEKTLDPDDALAILCSLLITRAMMAKENEFAVNMGGQEYVISIKRVS